MSNDPESTLFVQAARWMLRWLAFCLIPRLLLKTIVSERPLTHRIRQYLKWYEADSTLQQVLDDPFPYWSRYNPGIYVSWAGAGGCGNPGCGFSYASLKPFDNQVRWSAAGVGQVSKEALYKVDARRARRPSTWLPRTEAEQGTLPDEIEVKYPSCPRTKLVEAKWTIAIRPALLIQYLLCGSTKDGDGNGGAATVDIGNSWNESKSLDSLIFPDCGRSFPRRAVFWAIIQEMEVSFLMMNLFHFESRN
ncbi:hypothetical protein VN97_g10502 [Penicillium thymicola]|uniref:Uncharacterized protein n=1 Tax=Penicillium thymicola TaxID=293382 RepID=A0AAI9X3R9_PENTH|nr:hypothetical protein VN97_g10502 [Penicillium thymicola]